MFEAQRFPYVEIDPSLGSASALPYLQIVFVFFAASLDSRAEFRNLPVPEHDCALSYQ
jgi:hypothetical protein